MTRKEIDKFLANTKVYVAGKSREIQEKLFSLGYIWNNCRPNTVVRHIEAPFLFIYENKEITKSSDIEIFCSHENSEITADEIIALEITEPTYRPFKDKNECWNTMLKHEPFGWVSSKNEEALAFVNFIFATYIRVHDGYSINGWTFDYEEMFDKYTFADGTPFGIKKE